MQMKSGPGLSQQETHHAIHQAAFSEAERLTRLLRTSDFDESPGQVMAMADVLIEHWETRTLAHAQAEEEGLYREVVRVRPECESVVGKLTRDHDILRQMLAEVQGILSNKGWTDGIVQRFEAMLLVNSIHSRDEETFLFHAGEVTNVAKFE